MTYTKQQLVALRLEAQLREEICNGGTKVEQYKQGGQSVTTVVLMADVVVQNLFMVWCKKGVEVNQFKNMLRQQIEQVDNIHL